MGQKSETSNGKPCVYWIRVDLGAASKRSGAQLARNIGLEVKRHPCVKNVQMISDEKLDSLIGKVAWSAFSEGKKESR